MKELNEKMNYHFDNIDKEKFRDDWKYIVMGSISVGLNLSEFIAYHKRPPIEL
ncbi:hypothetical protein Nekkels1_22 [Cellulophaga phage Nekkels_1]|uniref:Uncharacterized protein n=1 Tax=Cellulophaga phage Nekkels_1 TaxID=2745692 RepID=A0A8E4XV24_9CAUD|nr:hypothetical protein M1M31_gp22 [Cellulophaga phage Nekkels_1]QQO97022.1 hypothetical protein Nekkels1_22 [Cellulophaga phage Nekkels_1]QQO97115.1 hypothetical protein Nekkels2_22 [Cellulophaga phage Nekkels_2]